MNNNKLGGHHASIGHTGGYCMFNNSAIAARVAIEQHGLQRVCIVDIGNTTTTHSYTHLHSHALSPLNDVHHGDGAQDILCKDPRVLTISLHRYDGGLYYPTTGHLGDVGKGTTHAPQPTITRTRSCSFVGAGEGVGKNIPWGLDAEKAGSGRVSSLSISLSLLHATHIIFISL